MHKSPLLLLSDIGMIFLPVLGYAPQYQDIRVSGNADGFSTFVSLILLVSNILRIFFWNGKRFETALLLQAFVMIIAQLIMLELCIRVKQRSGGYELVDKRRRKHIGDMELRHFWKWDDYRSFVSFVVVMTGCLLAVQTVIGEAEWFTELLGFLSLSIESTLGMPQWWNNYQKKSTAGLSIWLILSWVLGDSFKTAYFISTNAPLQFLMCGAVQIVVDFAIIVQIFSYSPKP
eukprot:GILJ01007826.1.p1 GENE.GILJ01007826.1~~GILJ01007826.1.p1  ORF type:complete len:271 (-),score=37.26 GILJ01007826.1:248-943(-)